MNYIKSVHGGGTIKERKYKTCPNPDCKKSIYHHTIQEARNCEGIAMRDAGN